MGNTDGQRRNEYALVTGASSGIGYELAKAFARNGFNLILVARSREGLEAAAQEITREYQADCRVMPADLSVVGDVEGLYKKVRADNLAVTVLVNDAGVGRYGLFSETDFAGDHAMINLNIVGLTCLAKLFAKDMVAGGSGKILNVASVVGFWPVPRQAVYAATKAYVISFSQALASELKGMGVQVSVLCPGVVATNFMGAGAKEEATSGSGPVARLMGRMKRMRYMKASAVASRAYTDLMKGKREIVPNNFMGRIVMFTMKVGPQGLMADLRARSRRRKSSKGQ